MTFRELIFRIEPYFWHDTPLRFLLDENDKPHSQEEANKVMGDTLALFLVRELYETFEPAESDDEQLQIACDAVSNSIKDLRNIVWGLGELLREKQP